MLIDGLQIDFEIDRSGQIVAVSPELPGLRVMGRNLDDVEAELPLAVRVQREAHARLRSPQG